MYDRYPLFTREDLRDLIVVETEDPRELVRREGYQPARDQVPVQIGDGYAITW